MRVLKNLYTLAGAGTATVLTGLATRAYADTSIDSNSALNPSGDANFSSGTTDFKSQFINIANQAITIILLISGVLAVIYLIWSGIQYITSAGNAEKAKIARGGIINAIIGIVIIVAAYFIVRFAVGIGDTVSNSAS